MGDLTHTELVARCDTYLDHLQCVLWGRALSINDPSGRAEAAEWLAQQVKGVLTSE